ncbi:MAG: hypothetical protein Q8K70_00930 [Bacteroidota bacterium]|nr:hypothetical protein [Bacteroidota bacterium]
MFIVFIHSSCNKKLEPIEYVNWFKTGNENLIENKSDQYIYQIRYISPEATLLLEFGQEKDSIKKYLIEEKNWSKFDLKIYTLDKKQDVLKYNNKHKNDYFQKMQYLITNINEDITAINKEGTKVPCAFHHFERAYNISPYINLTFSFMEKIENLKEINIESKLDNSKISIPLKQTQLPKLKL